MNTKATTKRTRLSVYSIVFAVLIAGGCQAVLPVLKAFVVAFGQDMLAAAAANYTPRYAFQLENLLAVMAREATGLNFQPQLEQVGYQPPPPKYMRRQEQRSETYNDPYQDQAEDPYADPYADPNADSQEYQYEDAYAADNADPYAEPATDPYADPYADPSADSAADPYAEYRLQPQDNPYATPGYASANTRTRGSAALRTQPKNVALGVALLVQRAGSNELQAIDDGAVVRDGRGDPASGDLLKIHFRSNCACYVYVIGVDATGFVAQIFPDPDSGGLNPVQAGVDYMMPAEGEWWALDDQRGIETLYFIASKTQRAELENALTGIGDAAAEIIGRQATRTVTRPAVIPTTRGMVKVSVPPVQLDSGAGTARVTPTAFVSTLNDVGVTVTRWFRHE